MRRETIAEAVNGVLNMAATADRSGIIEVEEGDDVREGGVEADLLAFT